jgi:hypothetical protein
MIKRLLLGAVFVIVASCLFFSPAFAAYSWVDDNGCSILPTPEAGQRCGAEESNSGQRQHLLRSVPLPRLK